MSKQAKEEVRRVLDENLNYEFTYGTWRGAGGAIFLAMRLGALSREEYDFLCRACAVLP